MIDLICPARFKEHAWNCIYYLDLEKYDVDVEIITRAKMHEHGLCWGDTKEVEIELSMETNESIWDFRCTIAHEMVHAKQFLSGEMDVEYGEQGVTLYRGRLYNHIKEPDIEPWETPAEKLEIEMMQCFYPKRYK